MSKRNIARRIKHFALGLLLAVPMAAIAADTVTIYEDDYENNTRTTISCAVTRDDNGQIIERFNCRIVSVEELTSTPPLDP